MKKYLLILILLFSSPVLAKPSYSEIETELDEEYEQGQQEDIEAIKLSQEALVYPDATSDDLKNLFEQGDYTTTTSRAEGYEPNMQAQMRAQSAEWHRAQFERLRKFDTDLRFSLNEIIKHADGDCGNSDFDVICDLEEYDVMLHGPPTESGPGSREPNPPYAETGSTSLNPSVHAASQAGDSCQDDGGNSAALEMSPVQATYPGEGCGIDAVAPIRDCTLQAVKRINASANGASCNSTQVMQPTVEPDRDKLQNVSQAQTSQISFPSCSTDPREAETVADISPMISGQRAVFEASTTTSDFSNTALVYQSLPLARELPWYGKVLAWVWPTTRAKFTDPAVTIRSQANAVGRARDIRAQNLAKSLGDTKSKPDMDGQQKFYNKNSMSLEAMNQSARTNLQETEEMNQYWQELAELNKKPF